MKNIAVIKRVFALIMAAIMTLACFACGNSKIKVDNAPSETGAFLDIIVKSGKAEKFTSDRPYDPNKEDISIILVVGQSNFQRQAGFVWQLEGYNKGVSTIYPDAPTQVPEGIAYSFASSEVPTSLDKTHDMHYLSNPERKGATVGGVTPSFALKWNELTGNKVVFIQAAVGGSGIHEWVPNINEYVCVDCKQHGKGVCFSNAVIGYMNAYNNLSRRYNIVYTGYIFNQGEHDEKRPNGCTVHNSQTYYEAYMKMHEGFMKRLKLDFGGISVVRANQAGNSVQSSRSHTIARGAQYRLANNEKDIFMLSTISETCNRSMMDQGGAHYMQKMFNEMGKEMAENLHTSLGLSEAKDYNGVVVYAADGYLQCRFDKDGNLTEGKNIITNISTVGRVLVKLETLGSAYTVDYDITVDGKVMSKYIDDYGKIDWTYLTSETGYKELTVRVTVK